MSKLSKSKMAGLVIDAIHQGTRGKQTEDLLVALQLLERLAADIRAKLARRGVQP